MPNFIFRINISDLDGAIRTIVHHIVAADQATALGALDALISQVDTLCLGKIESAEFCIPHTLPGGLKATPSTGADVEVNGRFIWNVTGGFITRVSLPTFDKDTYTVVGGSIDDTNSDVADYIDQVVNDGYTDDRWADITSLNRAYEAFGAS